MRFILALLAIIIAAPLIAAGAAPVYRLAGTVVEPSGEPVAYATIAAEGHAPVAADGEGRFTLALTRGSHRLTASAVGYTPAELTFYIDSDTAVTITLAPSSIALGALEVEAAGAARRLEEGAFAVKAVEVKADVNRITTLNSIIDRTAGVKVRREGGAGSETDLTVNGLSGNSIRYFIDGVPLESRGSAVNLDNIPVNMVDRVEIYKGVVPAALGADALGGAVNIVTRRARHNYLDASYGIASFGTHAASLTGQYIIPSTRIALLPSVSVDRSLNNYMMHDVEVWSDEADRFILTSRRRFHDRYFSLMAQLEAGVTDVAWADRFFVGASFDKTDKEIQTGAMQNKVYGDAARHSRSLALTVRYSISRGAFSARANLSHTFDRSATVDTAFRKYAWDGSWIPSAGNEMNGRERAHRVYRRPLTILSAGADYELTPAHTLSLNYLLSRQGNDRTDLVDRFFEPSNDVVTKHIASLTYSLSLMGGRWQSSAFVKDYVNRLSLNQTDDATITGAYTAPRRSTRNFPGGGAGTRFAIAEALSVKASYEHSVRLPLSRELLGNGTTVYPNLALSPETSNNVNLGFFGAWRPAPGHRLGYEAGAFIRHVQNYIRATVSERDGMMQYVNEPAIHIRGIEAEATYSADCGLRLSANASWSDARDLKRYKSDGNPSATYRNRVPNRPWLFANADASYTLTSLFRPDDTLRPSLSYQYIHWYYLNWEAYGSIATKARIPTQNTFDFAITYSWHTGRYNVTLECSNIFDRRVYDNYMLQKPGRAFGAKLRIALH